MSGGSRDGDRTGPAHDRDDGTGLTDLARAADRLYNAMRRSRAATVNQATSLSTSQVALLEPIADGGASPADALAVGELARAAEISVPTATRMISQLETRGVVVRVPDESDGRRVLVRLTDRGKAMLDAARDERRARQFSSLTAYTVDERHQLARELRRLAAVIDRSRIDAGSA